MTILRVLLVLGVLAYAVPTATAEVEVGQPAPQLDKAKDAKGKRVTLKALRGKPVVLHFCAVWAKSACKKSLPAYDEVAGRLKSKVVFLVVMVDNKEELAKDYVRSLKLSNQRFAFLPEERSSVVDEYVSENRPLPGIYLLDRDGVVQYIKGGYHDGDIAALEAEIGKLPE